jgi:DNA-binding response OmpR family regulator
VAARLNIVVVEDHDDLRELTCLALSHRGHQVIGLSCAEELEDEAGGGPVDVFVIDLNLPGEDGISLTKRLRHVYPLVGIVMLTARSQSKDKVLGYDSGADLYMTKPVNFEELCAAIQSFARRRQVVAPMASAAQEDTGLQPLRLSKLLLSGPGGDVRLSAAEADMLTAFARAPAGRLETWQLAQILDLDMSNLNKASLEVRIVRLRKKLQDVGTEGVVIESIRNVGYQLCVSLQII